jgi:tripartite-type tricarboxylate transporter receptor subunit TctC
MLNPTSNALPQVRIGKLKAFGVTPKRLNAAPDIPAISETLPGLEVTSWYGILAPATTPPRVVESLNREIVKALAASDVREALQALGLEPVGSTPQAFGTFIQTELRKWAQVSRDAGIKPE